MAEPEIVVLDPVEITVRRARRLWHILLVTVTWLFVYTSISLIVMVNLSNKLQDSCESRQAARTAIRTALSNDPDWTTTDQVQLDVNLPVKVKC